MKKITPEERRRLYSLCYNSKLGKQPNAENMRFSEKLLKQNEDEYAEISKQAACDAMNSVGGNQFEIVNGEIARK